MSALMQKKPCEFQQIPRNTRLMYIHAYQSLIWNEMASKRVSTFGFDLREGDLVYESGEDAAEIIDEGNIDESDDESAETDAIETGNENVSRLQKVKVLTRNDIDSNVYSIYDLLLPLPGFDVQYPANECSSWYKERLEKDSLSSQNLKQKNK